MQRSGPLGRLILLVSILLPLLLGNSWASWQYNGVPICTALNFQGNPQIVSDGLGGAIITWYDYRSLGNYDIYAQRVDPSGMMLWTVDGEAICTASGHEFDPEIVSDGAGGAIITWEDTRSGNSDIYAQRVGPLGATLWLADGVPICTTTNNQYGPRIVADGVGGAVITWFDYRSGSDYDIYAQRVNASGTVSWTVNGACICAATGSQRYPEPTSDGLGGAIITWEDDRIAGNKDIYARRVDATGAVLWTVDGDSICTAAGQQYDPRIIADGAGGAIVIWEDYRSGSKQDIYAQRIDGSGMVLWTLDGVAICTAVEDQWSPEIISDTGGGAIIVWCDYRGGVYSDICAQRLDISGSGLWPANGVPVCSFAGNQWYPELFSDGVGGAVVTWADRRSGTDIDVYAQRLDASGALLWPTEGVAVCTATRDQEFPQITSDGAGGAIITWHDHRSLNNDDIFAQHVSADGSTVAIEESVSRTAMTLLGQNVPNPFNPITSITFTVAKPGRAVLRIYNVAGKPVRTLMDGTIEARKYEVTWDGRDEEGRELSSGIYLYKLEAPGCVKTMKMVLLR